MPKLSNFPGIISCLRTGKRLPFEFGASPKIYLIHYDALIEALPNILVFTMNLAKSLTFMHSLRQLKTITFDLQAHMIEHVNVNDIH